MAFAAERGLCDVRRTRRLWFPQELRPRLRGAVASSRGPAEQAPGAGAAGVVQTREDMTRIACRPFLLFALPFYSFLYPEEFPEVVQSIAVARSGGVERGRSRGGYFVQGHAIPDVHNDHFTLLIRQIR